MSSRTTALSFGVLSLLMLSCSAVAQAREGWELVWADEFDVPGAPDPAKWAYEEGFIRNDELQYYTRDRRENVRVEDGSLVLEGRKESWPNALKDPTNWYTPRATRDTADYTSGSINTHGKAEFTYGRIEARIKLPMGEGVWPAFWMLGTNIHEVGWAKCGEIDIMEYVGKQPGVVHATAHYHTDQKRMSGGQLATEVRLDEFNVYAVEWLEDRMDFYFNDTKVHTFKIADADMADGANAFRKPQYVILNLALGGNWGGPMDPKIDSVKYEVDYVRVYQQAADAPDAQAVP